MAYTSDKKSTDLDALTAIANDDVLIVGDYDDSGIAKKITKTNFRTTFDATSSVKGFVTLSTAPASATAPIAVGDNDARIPTTGENDALAGTSGTPSSTNKYVTNDDARIPSQGENDALAGTAGTPSSSNKYVTNDDTSETSASRLARIKSTGKLDGSILPTSIVIKASDETINNGAVTSEDAELKFAVEANTNYVIRGYIMFGCATSATPDFQYYFSIPASPVKFMGWAHGVGLDSDTLITEQFTSLADSENALVSGNTGRGWLRFEIFFMNGANAGTFAFKWAQNTATVADTKVFKGSCLEYMKA